jgi:hypothetical protein
MAIGYPRPSPVQIAILILRTKKAPSKEETGQDPCRDRNAIAVPSSAQHGKGVALRTTEKWPQHRVAAADAEAALCREEGVSSG